MSGYKQSSTTLSRERETKLRTLEKIKTSKNACSGVKIEIDKILRGTAQGIKATFATEVKKAMTWLSSLPQDGKRQDMSSSIGELEGRLQSFASQFKQGREILSQLMNALHEKAGAMEKQLRAEMAEMKALNEGYKYLLGTWTREEISVVQDGIEKSEALLNDKRLSDSQSELARLGDQLSQAISQAKELSLKHEKRLYVLKAVRQAATDLGFEELSAPYYTREGDLRSHIIYRVDTLNQGEITFYLSLDGIGTHSQIADEKCHDEFDKLSAHLEKEFGVKTHFRSEDATPDQRRIAKGELDFPDEGATVQQHRISQ